jgi:hypothetical protein
MPEDAGESQAVVQRELSAGIKTGEFARQITGNYMHSIVVLVPTFPCRSEYPGGANRILEKRYDRSGTILHVLVKPSVRKLRIGTCEMYVVTCYAEPG